MTCRDHHKCGFATHHGCSALHNRIPRFDGVMYGFGHGSATSANYSDLMPIFVKDCYSNAVTVYCSGREATSGGTEHLDRKRGRFDSVGGASDTVERRRPVLEPVQLRSRQFR